jgi:renal tumor antigen
MHQYKLISRKGEGTFSEVLKAQSLKTGNFVAIKCMKTHFNSVEQVNQLREIQALRKCAAHPNIIKLLEILYDEPTGRLALVFELMDINMYELVKDRKTYLSQSKVKQYMYQLFKAIEILHRKGIFHRDIKPENILLSGDLVKLADLGSCKSTTGKHPYTEYISTRWYRSPECLMTDGYYDQKMDIWGAGCVMFEILTLVPLFPGKNELDMIHRIHNILGTPSQKVLDRLKSRASHMEFNFPQKAGTGIEKLLPHVSPDCLDLLKQLLAYDSEERISADQILQHEYFREMSDTDRNKDFQSTRSSIRPSPSIKQLQQNISHDSEKLTTVTDKPSFQQQSNAIVKKPKKIKNPNFTMNKFPSLNVNVKVEGVFKHSHNDTSTEEEPEKLALLPPLKNQPSSIQMETKFSINTMNQSFKKKEDQKKLASTIVKSSVYNPLLYKKSLNNNTLQPQDYFLVGKKAI